MKYSNSFTQRYKMGYIHSATIEGNEIVKVQVNQFAYIVYVKSIPAAKLLITKHLLKNSGLK